MGEEKKAPTDGHHRRFAGLQGVGEDNKAWARTKKYARGVTTEREVARALAFFERCNDLPVLLDLLRSIRPRAAQEVRRYERSRRPVPPPAKVAPSEDAATRDEALRTVRATRDFALLQALSRQVGRRVEELQRRDGNGGPPAGA